MECLFLLLLLIVSTVQLAAGQQSCTVRIGENLLLQCLEDQRVTEIILEEDDVIEPGDWPLTIRRNVTLRGPVGRSPDNRPVLDLRNAYGALQLCSACVFTLQDLVLANDRVGSGPAYDLFTGKPGSKVRSINTYRLRLACTPGEQQLKAVQALERSKLFPGSTAPQDIVLRDIAYRGKVYAGAVWSNNISLDVPYKYDEGGTTGGREEGGYALATSNSTWLCEQYVSAACLSESSADTCVQELIRATLGSPAPKPPGMAVSTAVAITVPVVVGFMLAGGFVAWWLRRRCMRGSGKGSSLGLKLPRQSGPQGPLLTALAMGTGASGDSSDSCNQKGPPVRSQSKPLARTTGWEQLDSQTAPYMGLVEDTGIELGAFIGAGSFGKVFKGRWNGMEVAVKVIEHSGSSAAAVVQEMAMMMAFQHPHIVRAYRCVHYVHNSGGLESEYSGSLPSRHNSGVLPSSVSFTHPAAGMTSSTTLMTATSLAVQPSPLSRSSSKGAVAAPAAASAAVAGGGGGSSCLCASVSGDAALTITEGAPCCHGQPVSCQCATSCSAAAPLNRVHFDAQPSHNGADQQPMSAFASSAFCSNTGSRQQQLLQQQHTSCSQPCSRQQQQQQHVTDSLGSSVDCKCVAAAGVSTADASVTSMRRSKSAKEPCQRFESWLVLEYCDKGSLSSYLAQWPAPYEGTEPGSMLRVLQLLQDTAQGLDELHREHVVHGDLNARNVLVASCSVAASGVVAKLADLGLSRSIKQHQTHRTTNTIGTMNHMAPEMLRSGQMSVSADVYALGIMMWELYTGEDAFERLQHPGQFFETVVLQDLRPILPQGMPADYQLLMQHCWATEPSARPAVGRVLECLQYMIRERQQQAAASSSGAAGGPTPCVASDPLPHLLAHPPQRKQIHWWQAPHVRKAALVKGVGSEASASQPANSAPASQASSSVLPSFSLPWGLSPPNSDTPLPVLNVQHPADTALPLDTSHQEEPWALQQPQQQQQQKKKRRQQAREPVQEQAPAGFTSQPLPAVFSEPSHSSVAFFRRGSMRQSRQSNDLPQLASREGSVADSVSHRSNSSSGRLPSFLAGVSASHPSNSSSGRLPSFLAGLRQGSLRVGSGSFERDPSWSGSGRQGSQTGVGDLAWFV